jgi:dienelactone hydrolase
MQTMKHWLVVLATFALVSCAGMGAKPPAIKEEPVNYKDGNTTLKGFVVYDEARQGRRPGMLVVHEWWGITPHVRGEARKFAEQGYTAIVVDMYGDGQTATTPRMREARGQRNEKSAGHAVANAARAGLVRHSTVDSSRIGAAGYCFGGAVALNMARAGADLRAWRHFRQPGDKHAGTQSGEAADPGAEWRRRSVREA